MVLLQTDIIFKLCTKIKIIFNFFFVENVTLPDMALLQKKVKVDILAQSKKV